MKAQVIIVGGGVIGVACAYFISRRGMQVLILESHHLGAGASGASATMMNVSGTSGVPEPIRPFAFESHNLILELEQDFEQPLEVIRGGSLVVAMNEQEAQRLKAIFKGNQQMGIDCSMLNGLEARRLEPLLSPQTMAALYSPLNYHINPFRLCEGYLNGALRRGAKIAYNVNVLDVQVKNDRISRIITEQGDYYADWVIVAAGAYTPQILSSIDVQVPVVPGRGQAIVTEACPPMTTHALEFLSHVYARQVANGNFYLGSHTEFVGFDNQVTLEKISAYTRALARAVPIIARLRALRFFVGFRPMTPDNLPIIGSTPTCSRLILATGHGRTGMRHSASTGKAVSELIKDGETRLPIADFAVDRFAQKNRH